MTTAPIPSITDEQIAEMDAARYQFMACACEVTYMGTVIEDEAQFDRVMSGGKP